MVRLSFPGRGLHGENVEVESSGTAEAEGRRRPASVAAARKQSRARATQSAFSKLLLVVVDGGSKVAVQADLSRPDPPCQYEATWERFDAGRVQEVDYDPEEEDDKGNDC